MGHTLYSINYGSQLIINSFLTKFHPDVLIGVRVPKGVVLVTVAHQREDDVSEESVEVRLDQLPRISMVHPEEKGKEGARGERERGREEKEGEIKRERERRGGGGGGREREIRGRGGRKGVREKLRI